MIIATASFSGNVGKTTVSQHIILPRRPEATLVEVETINAGASGDAVRVRADQFGRIQDIILDGGELVIDIGASNIEKFFDGLQEFDGSHEDIDRFVIPVTPETKQQIDTISTIRSLISIGVPADHIAVVFNRVPRKDRPREIFPAIFGYHKEMKRGFRLDERAAITESEIFDSVKLLDRSILDLATDTTDYKAQLGAASETAASRIKATIAAIRLARPTVAQFDYIHDFIAS